jgi:hypothetical protein
MPKTCIYIYIYSEFCINSSRTVDLLLCNSFFFFLPVTVVTNHILFVTDFHCHIDVLMMLRKKKQRGKKWISFFKNDVKLRS